MLHLLLKMLKTMYPGTLEVSRIIIVLEAKAENLVSRFYNSALSLSSFLAY